MKIKEIMVKEVMSVKPTDSVHNALAFLFKNEISGLPVIDEEGKLLGMFTEEAVLSYILPSYVEKVGRFIYEDNPKATTRKLAELGAIKVDQLMRRDVVTVREESSLSEAAKVMLTQNVHRLPVVDSAGKILGIVACCDILKAISRGSEITA